MSINILKFMLGFVLGCFIAGVVKILISELVFHIELWHYDKSKKQHIKEMRERIEKGLDN